MRAAHTPHVAAESGSYGSAGLLRASRSHPYAQRTPGRRDSTELAVVGRVVGASPLSSDGRRETAN